MKTAVLLVLMAATPAQALEPPPCVAARAKAVTGKEATPARIKLAQKKSGAHLVRVIRPGQAVTMDYRLERLNVHVNARKRITRLTCG